MKIQARIAPGTDYQSTGAGMDFEKSFRNFLSAGSGKECGGVSGHEITA